MGRKYFFQSVRIITCRNDPKNIRNTPSSPYPPSFSSSSPRDPLHAPTSTPPPPSTEARRRILRSYVVGPSSSPAPLEWRAVKIHLEPAQGSDSLVVELGFCYIQWNWKVCGAVICEFAEWQYHKIKMGDGVAFEAARKIIMHPLYGSRSSPWLDLRVFYVRVSNCVVDESAPEHLTLNHIPLSPDTVIEVNGRRSSMHTEFVSSSLRRDRIDKMAEEATYVSTDSIRMTGSVRFQVFDKNDLLLTGDLELCNANGVVGEPKSSNKKWNIKCQSSASSSGFLKGKMSTGPESAHPVVEVYLAGTFSGTPIILTKTIQYISRRKSQMKLKLDSIPENEATELQKENSHEDPLKVSEFQDPKSETDVDVDYNNLYARQDFLDGEDGALSWFNAGVRVGVGIGLGVCVGVGLGAGLLIRTYQSTSRNFRRRLP